MAHCPSPEDAAAQQVARDPIPRCINFHPLTKCKKLKAWQVRGVHKCGLCGILLQRNEFRWRCLYHCEWDMCQHCYDKHWSKVIEVATSVESRQQRLGLLSAVPEARRQAKDFQAAFAENPDDARLLLPPATATRPEGAPPDPVEKAGSQDFELPEGESLLLRCSEGHVVTKKKKLKPWQEVSMKNVFCDECQERIPKDDFRWRCEHHCTFNVCDDCYNAHYASIISLIKTTRNEERCWQLLSAVPLHMRDTPEYHAARNRVARRAKQEEARQQEEHNIHLTYAQEQAALAAFGTEAGPSKLRGRIQGCVAACDKALEQWPYAQVAFWTLLAAYGEHMATALTRAIQGPSVLAQVKAPYLVAGLSTLIGAALLQAMLAALRLFRRHFGELPPVPAPPPILLPFMRRAMEQRGDIPAGESFPRRRRKRRRRPQPQLPEEPRFSPEQPHFMQVYVVLGVLMGLEWAIRADCHFRAPIAAECLGLGFYPICLLLAGQFCEGNWKDQRLTSAMCLAASAGLLLLPGAWQKPKKEFDIAMGMGVASLFDALRWGLTNNVLAPSEYLPSERFSAGVVLSANMATTAALCLMELSIVFNLTGFAYVVDITDPLTLVVELSCLGIAQAARLVAYLNLARAGSIALIGLVPLIPATFSVLAECVYPAAGEPAPTWINFTAALLALFSMACFTHARMLKPQLVPPEEGYEPLSDADSDAEPERGILL